MTSVWKRLQRVGKKASKFQFVASFQELVVECTDKWQPDKLRVVWIRRNRRHSTKLHSWQPGIKNPYRGMVIWQVPESLDITVTLFKEPTAEEFEDKDWTFVIENETKGRRKVLASAEVNMKKYASATLAQYDVTLKLKPLSVKVVEATLKLNLSCVFLKEGKATDEDMQSLASLMSMKQSDIGNLDDFNDSDDEVSEERRSNFGQSIHVTAFAPSTTRIHDLAWRPAIESGLSVTSEMDWNISSGISSTISVPSCPPLPDPPDPSLPCSLLQTQRRPPSTAQQALPSHYAYTLPAFARAHPPVLPKIFQPSAGSAPRRPHSFHSESSPAEGWVAQAFCSFTPAKSLSTSSLPSSDPPLHPSAFSETSQTDCPDIGRVQNFPVFSFDSSSSSSAPVSSFPHVPPSPPTPRQPKGHSTLTRPTSLPSAPDTEFKRQLSTLSEEDNQCTTPSSPGPRAPTSQKPEQSKALTHKRDARFEIEVVKPSPGHESVVSQQPLCTVVAGAAVPLCHNEIKNAEQHSEKQPTKRTIQWEELPKATTQKWHKDRTIQWEELPKRTSEVNTSEEEMDMITEIVSIVPSSPGAAIISNINNKMQKKNTEARMEYPANVKQPQECLQDSKSTWNKPSMDNEIITTEWDLHSAQADLVEQMVNVSSTVSPQCVPYHVTTETEYRQSTLLETCSQMTNIAGHPSMQEADNKDWNTIPQPLWEKPIKQEFVLLLENIKIVQEMKGIVSLVQSSPRESHIFGFPSVSKARMNNVDMTNMVTLSTSYSKVSQILGFPSSHNLKEWTLIKEPIFQRQMKEKQVSMVYTCERDKTAMKVMVSLVPSCPKVAWTPGFPSYPHPDIISLFTLCSRVSKIPGFPSVGGDMNIGWVTKEESFKRLLKLRRDIFDRSHDNKAATKNMVSCLPSCPKISTIHGFTSIPNPKNSYYGLNVVYLLPMCPLDSTIPGFSSVEGYKKKGWVVELVSFIDRPEKNIKFKINSPPGNIVKPNNMLALVPSCPGASKIPGFPSVPRYNILSLVPLCPKVFSFPGFASIERGSKLHWLFDPHTFSNRLPKDKDFVIHSTNQERETVRTMLALVPSCPEASRIPGFPSAPQTKSKIEYIMKNFIQCCSSVSSLKGFASMTTIPSTGWLSGTKPFFKKPQKKRTEMIMKLGGQDCLNSCNIKRMVTLVTSCPTKTRVHGFPSAQAVNRQPNMVSLYTSIPHVSFVPGLPSARTFSSECMTIQIRPTLSKSLFEKLNNKNVFVIAHFPGKQDEMKYMVAMAPTCPLMTRISGFPSTSQFNPTEKTTITSQELSNAQSTQSYHKDTRMPGVTSISVSNRSTKPVNEKKSKDFAKQNIDVSVDKGKAAEEAQTMKKSLDTSEPVVVLGWEVLEAEGPITHIQAESSLSAKEEETSGLVKAIVGVFHKGYETVASVLGPSSSTLAKVDHQPRPIEAFTSMDVKDKTVTPSDEFIPQFTDNTTSRQRIGGPLEHISSKHSTSAEPYIWNLAGDQASPSSTTNSDDKFVVCSSMKKWPPLTEDDITEITKEDDEKLEEQQALLNQCQKKERSLTGHYSVCIEGLLAKHHTETEQNEVRTVSSSLQLDKCPQKTSKEDMPGTSLQPTSNNLLTNNNRPNELLLDKPSEDLNTSPVGPQVDIGVPPQQKVCHQKKDTVPVQPVKMKDVTASAPDCIQKSDNFAKANDLTPSCGINKGESSIVQDTTEYAVDHKQKCETGPVHISLDVVPPPHVKRRDDSLPTETLKTALFKPLRRKDKKMHADSAYQQTDTESVCLTDTKETLFH
ncbi:uncharacterized protein LOC113157714 isoform X3 [Anabas testudineus]|uniref:uncharacterized protein LOC113157714 isoform X3 n=1 Tax=Anabas testudineus TaxID=64144 RepID=UPI000E4652DD|nr:uncharacterized protein LOC113157714 isoform X3 [Anabas testudineus]